MYTFNRQFPHTRLRRLRISDGIREMVRETQLAPCHLIAPVFVIEGMNQKQSIHSMPNVHRYSIDLLIDYVRELYATGVRMIDIFPVIDPKLKRLTVKMPITTIRWRCVRCVPSKMLCHR